MTSEKDRRRQNIEIWQPKRVDPAEMTKYADNKSAFTTLIRRTLASSRFSLHLSHATLHPPRTKNSILFPFFLFILVILPRIILVAAVLIQKVLHRIVDVLYDTNLYYRKSWNFNTLFREFFIMCQHN